MQDQAFIEGGKKKFTKQHGELDLEGRWYISRMFGGWWGGRKIDISEEEKKQEIILVSLFCILLVIAENQPLNLC